MEAWLKTSDNFENVDKMRIEIEIEIWQLRKTSLVGSTFQRSRIFGRHLNTSGLNFFIGRVRRSTVKI